MRAGVRGGLAVAVAAAVAVALPATRDRPEREPAAAADSCPGHRTPPRAAPGLRPPAGVPGSLGGDQAAVTAVLRTGWEALLHADGPGSPLDPGTATVRLVQRTGDGWIVGVVSAHGSGSERRYGRDAVVAGRDVTRLRSRVAPEAYEGTGGVAARGGRVVLPAGLCGPVRPEAAALRGPVA